MANKQYVLSVQKIQENRRKSASTETSVPATWATNVRYRRSSNKFCDGCPMRNCCVSARTPRTCGHATTSRLFPRKLARCREMSGPRRPRGRLARIFRIAFRRMPLELVHWVKSLRAVSRTDMLIVAGTGIVTDYLLRVAGLALRHIQTVDACCALPGQTRVPQRWGWAIRHPLSRWFLKRSLALAHHRSYRDEASKQYLREDWLQHRS